MYSFPNMLFLHKSLMFPTSSLSRCMLCCLWEMFLAFTRTVCAAAAALMLPTRCFITLGTARDPLSQKSQAGMCVEQSHAKFYNRRHINSVFRISLETFLYVCHTFLFLWSFISLSLKLQHNAVVYNNHFDSLVNFFTR